ncbi:MAG: hypothetical protein AB7L84_07630 [Acidimicrobiia bacterium]
MRSIARASLVLLLATPLTIGVASAGDNWNVASRGCGRNMMLNFNYPQSSARTQRVDGSCDSALGVAIEFGQGSVTAPRWGSASTSTTLFHKGTITGSRHYGCPTCRGTYLAAV